MRLNKIGAVAIGICLALHGAPSSAADGPESVSAGAAVPQPALPEGVSEVQKERLRAPDGKVQLALTLAGGGARGAAHIGVLKVLDQEGIRPDFVSGSSMGALIGALYAAGLSGRDIERLALSGELKKAFFPVPLRLKGVLYLPQYWACRLVGMHPAIGIYSGKSLARFMERHLPPNVRNIEDTRIPIAVTATNLVDTRPVWLTKGDLGEAVRASCSVPLLYRPVEKNGGELVDGGIRENLPTQVAQAAGAPVVLAVKLHSYLQKVPKKEFDTNLDLADRLTSIFMADIENCTVAGADVIVEPQVEYMKLRSFQRADLMKAIAAGEAAARESLPELKKLLKTETTASRPVTRQ